jgi:hypothetical protein
LIVLGLLPPGVWALANLVRDYRAGPDMRDKLGSLAQGGALKWASLALAVILGAGLVWAGSTKFGLKAVEKTVQFDYTGGPQWWAVPDGVKSVWFTASGAQGGAGCPNAPLDLPGKTFNAGGYGVEIGSMMEVTPGQVFQINVAGKGQNGNCATYGTPGSNAAGGWNGGGAGGAGAVSIQTPIPRYAGGGGGASDVRHAPFGLADRDLVGAGGGGGSGGSYGYPQVGGNGGIWSGEPAPNANGQGGGAGTLVIGGSGGLNGGNGSLNGQAGTFGIGGAGANHGGGLTAGGGGGGGWYGGGGGGSGATTEYGGGGGGGGGHWPGTIYYVQQLKNNYFNGGISDSGMVKIEYTQYVSIFNFG